MGDLEPELEEKLRVPDIIIILAAERKIVTVYRSSAIGRPLLGRWVSAFAASVLSLCGLGVGQTHSGFPVDLIAGPAPHPVMADGRMHL